MSMVMDFLSGSTQLALDKCNHLLYFGSVGSTSKYIESAPLWPVCRGSSL